MYLCGTPYHPYEEHSSHFLKMFPVIEDINAPRRTTYSTSHKRSKAYQNRYENPSLRRQTKGVSTKTKARSLKRNYFKYHISAFPQHEFETLRYSYTGTNQTLATQTYAEAQFAMNGPFDPDGGISATQPAGFQKLMAVYTKCLVRSAKIRIDFSNVVNAGVYANMMVGITLSTTSTTLASVPGAINPGLTTYKPLGNSPDTCTLTLDVDCMKFLGVQLGNEGSQFYATTAANPSQGVFAHMWLFNQFGATAIYNFCVTIDYDCDFYDPIPVT